MSCHLIDEYLDHHAAASPAAFVPAWVGEHLDGCERCRALFQLLGSPGPEQSLPPQLQARIEKSILVGLRPVAPLPPGRAFALGFLAIFALLAGGGISLMGIRPPGLMSAWQFAGVGAVLGAAAVFLAVSLSRQMAPGSSPGIRPITLILGIATAMALAFLLLFPWNVGGNFVGRGFRCAASSLVLTVPAGVGFWLLLRRGAILSAGVAGAATGLLAGLAGAMVLHFGCVIVEAPHLLVWHAGVAVSSALTGFLIGKYCSRRS